MNYNNLTRPGSGVKIGGTSQNVGFPFDVMSFNNLNSEPITNTQMDCTNLFVGQFPRWSVFGVVLVGTDEWGLAAVLKSALRLVCLNIIIHRKVLFPKVIRIYSQMGHLQHMFFFGDLGSSTTHSPLQQRK